MYNRHATLKCSRRCLQIDFQVLIPENLPSSNEVDIRPFLYSNVDLLKMEDAESTPALREPQQTGKYAWAVDDPWAWNEAVWSTRLLHCIQEAEVFRDVEVIPAFQWKASGYEEAIGSLFPTVRALHVTLFHGMTDILLRCKQVAVINILQPSCVCCVEVGKSGGSTHMIAVNEMVATEDWRAVSFNVLHQQLTPAPRSSQFHCVWCPCHKKHTPDDDH